MLDENEAIAAFSEQKLSDAQQSLAQGSPEPADEETPTPDKESETATQKEQHSPQEATPN